MEKIVSQIDKKLSEFYLKNNIKLKHKPLLVGGIALEYYNVRKSGHDIDFLIHTYDKQQFLDRGAELNLFGGETEKDVDSTFTNAFNSDIDFALTYWQYGYDFWMKDTIETNNFYIASLEMLLLIKVFASKSNNCSKHKDDMDLLIKSIIKKQYN